MTVAIEIFGKLLDFVSDKPVSLYQVAYATRLDARTIKKYLSIIELIQSHEKIRKEIIGSRVFFKK